MALEHRIFDSQIKRNGVSNRQPRAFDLSQAVHFLLDSLTQVYGLGTYATGKSRPKKYSYELRT